MPIIKITAVEFKSFTILLYLPDNCNCNSALSFFKHFLEKTEDKTVFEHSTLPVRISGSACK
jgi:hypothetical protein